MIADKNFVGILRNKYHLEIDERFEAYILAEYEEEPFPNEWSEQDLYEQIRKLAMTHKKGKLDTTVKPPIQRLRERYEELQGEYMDLAFDVQALLHILEENGIDSPFKVSGDKEEVSF